MPPDCKGCQTKGIIFRMQKKGLSLPDQKSHEYGYNLAYELACDQLAKLDDIEQQCHRSGAQYKMIDSKKLILLKY